MRAFFSSIVSKLWVSMVLLLIGILALLGVLFGQLFERFYLDLEAKAMIKQGEQIAEALITESAGVQKVQEMADLFAKESNSTILVADPNGMVKACSNMMMMPRHFRLAAEEFEALQEGKAVVRQALNPYYDIQTLSVAVPVIRDKKVEQAVFLYAPLEPITATTKKVKGLIFLVALGSIGLASLLAFFLSKRLSWPLLQINQAAEAMIRGNYEGKVEVRSEDEVGRLARTFNTLARELKEQEKLRKDFVANVSHELRTPLFLIQGYGEALASDLAEDKVKREESAKVIIEETNRMQRLVDDLLDLAQMEAGRLKMAQEPLSLTQLVSRVCQKFETLAANQGVALNCPVPDDLLLIAGDEDRIQQVFINLLDNAFRFTPRGGKIEIMLKQDSQGALVEITDSGQGIAPEELPYIWERFYKVEKSRTRKNKGTGLGLAIVKKIVEAHGGTVHVYSTIGSGTKFVFKLPFA